MELGFGIAAGFFAFKALMFVIGLVIALLYVGITHGYEAVRKVLDFGKLEFVFFLALMGWWGGHHFGMF